MDATLAVRAAVQGVKPEVCERMEAFSVTAGDAEKLLRVSVKALQAAVATGLTIQKIVELATTRTVRDDETLRSYATLVNQLSTEQIASLGERKLIKMHEFLQAGFSVEDALALCRQGGTFDVRDAIDARKHGITISDVVEAWAVRYDSDYVRGRKAGAAHAELLEVLSLTENVGTDFSLSDYIAIISKGVATHEQVVAMLHTHTPRMRQYYAEFVLGTETQQQTITHDQAMEVLETPYYYPSDYWEARWVASHSEVIEIATAGMSAREYVPLRQSNPRVTHGEIVQLARLGGRASELPLFIRLIDAGYPYDDIRASKMSVSYYYHYRASDSGPHLTQAQVLEVQGLPLTLSKYGELLRQGIPHETIVQYSK